MRDASSIVGRRVFDKVEKEIKETITSLEDSDDSWAMWGIAARNVLFLLEDEGVLKPPSASSASEPPPKDQIR